MELKDIKKVLILGAGAMGQQIGYVCAMHGYNVTLYDISEDILKTSVRRMEKLGSSWFVPIGRITAEQHQEIMGRITATSDPQAAAKDADIISESVPEDPKLKADVFALFNGLCPERTIFTTNASLLMPSKFADATGRPKQFAALHFHDLRVSDVVDVMAHPGTDPAVTE
ncbi:MAG TPA: 3-hydroxyacyl-CoA dehydrogenase NAD-binding domain-containing protein, partial [Smithellaceae bacterium]|nr:3-hydroxyacyl-CoA dehydrogenase NAD-binding domain-containing protein [Smithellaceae bacterium]